MAKDEFNLDEFLAEREFEDDAEKAVVTKFFSKEKNQRAVLAQKAFDRKMDAAKTDLETQKSALAEKQETLDRLVTQNIEYKGSTEKEVEAFKAKTEKEIKVLRGKAVKAAELAGMDLEEIEADETLTPKPRAAFDLEAARKDLLKGVVTGDDLNRMATGHINLTLELDDVKDTYEELNGKKLSVTEKRKLLDEYGKDIAVATKAGVERPPLMQTADRLYEFSGKREEISSTKLKKLLEDAEARGRQKAIQEAGDSGLPTPRREGAGSPIFNHTRKAGEAIDPQRGVKLAMEAIQKKQAVA